MNIVEKMEKFLLEISKNEKLNIDKNNVQEIQKTKDMPHFLTQLLVKNAQKRMKIEIPKEDYQYHTISSLTLDWDAPANITEEEYLWGGFQILSLFETLSPPSHFWDIYNNDDRFWNNNPQPKAEAIWKDFLPKLNYFHKSGHGDDGTFGCLLREEGVYPCPVYFYDSGIWFEMDFTLEEYYDKMLECKAVYYWQYFYIKTETIVEKLGNFKPMYEEYGANYLNGPHPFMSKFKDGTFTTSAEALLYQMEVIIERFPKLFPEVDTTYFKQQYEALKNALNKREL